MTTWAARRLLADSLDLVHRLPGVAMAVENGWCDLSRARMVAAGTRDLSAATAGIVHQQVQPLLRTLTPRRLQELVKRIAAQVEPAALSERAESIRSRREVWIDSTNDDHAEVAATLDTLDAQRLTPGSTSSPGTWALPSVPASRVSDRWGSPGSSAVPAP